MASPLPLRDPEGHVRIISKFHDYYDSVQSYGQDRTLVYVRNKELTDDMVVSPIPPFRFSRPESTCPSFEKPKAGDFIYRYATVGFCGKLYPCMIVEIIGQAKYFIYKMEHLDDYVAKVFTKDRERERYHEGKIKKRETYWQNLPFRYIPIRSDMEKLFEFWETIRDKETDLFVKRNVPIFVVRHWHNYIDGRFVDERCVLNECLKDFEFYRVFDTNAAYQEIAMFVGGILTKPPTEIPKPSDEVLAEIKGFNKWSFRKEPKGP